MMLTSQAARVAFILEVIDRMRTPDLAGTIKFLESTAESEVQTRPRNKPCMAENVPHVSTIAAARYLAHHRQDLWVNSAAALRMDAHAVTENLRNRVKNWCNADDVPGYFWI